MELLSRLVHAGGEPPINNRMSGVRDETIPEDNSAYKTQEYWDQRYIKYVDSQLLFVTLAGTKGCTIGSKDTRMCSM